VNTPYEERVMRIEILTINARLLARMRNYDSLCMGGYWQCRFRCQIIDKGGGGGMSEAGGAKPPPAATGDFPPSMGRASDLNCHAGDGSVQDSRSRPSHIVAIHTRCTSFMLVGQ